MELCKRLEAEEATLNSVSLPQELLENIFHRLPFAALRHAKQVCREWGRVLHSASFTSSYRSTVKLVQTWMPGRTLVEVIDGDGNVLRVRDRNLLFGRLACSRTGLLTCFCHAEYKVLVGNLFTNKWEEVLAPVVAMAGDEGYVGDCLAVFGFGDGRYRLVYWDVYGDLCTLESGDQEWTDGCNLGRTRAWPDPVVIGTSLFRMDDEDKQLLEYTMKGKVTAVPLTRKDKGKLALAEGEEWWEGIRELVAWENRLYLLLMFNVVADEEESWGDSEHQKMELWNVSMDGVCTLVMEQELDEVVGFANHVEIEDGKLVVLYRNSREDDDETEMFRLTFDMETKKLESFSDGLEPLRICVTVPVTLC